MLVWGTNIVFSLSLDLLWVLVNTWLLMVVRWWCDDDAISAYQTWANEVLRE